MNPQRILFATMPFDGHFSPLTNLAVHLSQLGHDVRWFVGGHYGQKVTQLGLHHYPYVKTRTVNQENLDQLFPERATIKGAIARIRFDLGQIFLLRVPEQIDDLRAIYDEWPFDLIVQDLGFVGGTFLRELLPVKVVGVGVVPLTESDDWVPPTSLGMKPQSGRVGRLVSRLLNYLVQDVMLKPANDLHNELRAQYGLRPVPGFIFDATVRQADLYLQSGVPGFEFPRKRISPNVRFIGPMLPYSRANRQPFEQAIKTLAYKRVVLVTQGTVERNVEKIIVPTLEAYKKDPDTLVIVTTGGSGTLALRKRYPQANFIIEDFIDFNAVMPYVSVYVTNGGYGGVMLALQHKLPIVAAGVHEGKNEIAARIGYCQVGVDLRTETPTPDQIRRAVATILGDETYRRQVRRLSDEFGRYNPNQLAEQYINELLAQSVGEPVAALS
ncbi:glycosyltransferase [Fibrella aestuarina]|nr:glycosyltransferase [Fibrella aestuarina]